MEKARALGPALGHAASVGSAVSITVKTLLGEEFSIEIEMTDTIERIKERVEDAEGTPAVKQRRVRRADTLDARVLQRD